MTERLDFLYLRFSRREEFTRRFEVLQKEMTKGEAKVQNDPKDIMNKGAGEIAKRGHKRAIADKTPDRIAEGTTTTTPPPKELNTKGEPGNDLESGAKKARAKAKTTTSPGAKGKAPGQAQHNKKNKLKTDFDIKVAEADETKALHLSLTGQALYIQSGIEKDDSWSWAKTAAIQGRLCELTKGLDTALATLDECGKRFIVGWSAKDLVNAGEEENVMASLIALRRALHPELLSLQAHLAKITDMHTIHNR